MIYIRNLIYWIILIVSMPLMFIAVLFALPFDKGVNKVGRAWVKMLLWVLKNIVGLNYIVRGAENIPSIPSIICSKHQSAWETFALQEIFPLQIYVAKKELFKIPFFGWGLKLAKTIGIDRKAGAKAPQMLLEQGQARKKEGFWIVIFPEGTRMAVGERGRYKLGGARMAKLFEMDIVPVALNSGVFWAKNAFLKYPGTIEIVIGQPISYHAFDTETDLMKACETWIEEQQKTLAQQRPQ